MSVVATVLRYAEYGDPSKVVKKCEERLNDPESNEILVKILAAPINPADINTIQGLFTCHEFIHFTSNNNLLFQESIQLNQHFQQFLVMNVSLK